MTKGSHASAHAPLMPARRAHGGSARDEAALRHDKGLAASGVAARGTAAPSTAVDTPAHRAGPSFVKRERPLDMRRCCFASGAWANRLAAVTLHEAASAIPHRGS